MEEAKQKRRSLPLLYKYLFTYASILIVPLLILGVSGYNQLRETVHEQSRENQFRLLREITADMDEKWMQLHDIAGRISVNPLLTPYSISNYFSAAYTANPFLDYMISTPYLHEIVYYVHGEPYLFSSASTYPLDMFMGDIYHYPEWEEEEFLQTIRSLQEPMLRPAEEVTLANAMRKSLITYLVPVPFGSSNPYGTVMFMIEEPEFLESSRYLAEYERGGLLMFDPEKQRIAAHDAYGGASLLIDVPAMAGTAFAIQEAGGEEYYVSLMDSQTNGFIYVLATPVEKAMGAINQAVSYWFKTGAVVFLIGGFLIFAAMYYNYYPIHRLVKLAEKYWGRSEERSDEIDRVGALLARTAETNQRMNRRMEESRHAIRQHMLLELLAGEIESLEEWNRQGEDAGVRFDSDRLVVAVVEGDGWDAAAKRIAAEEMERRETEQIRGFVKDPLPDQRLIFVGSLQADGTAWKEWLQQLHQALYERFGKGVVIGAGKVYEGLIHAGRSLIEANTAADYKLIKGGNRVIFFEELGLEDEPDAAFPRQDIERLRLYIRQGQTEQVKQAVDAITRNIQTSRATLVMARSYCYQVLTAVAETVHEVRSAHPGLAIDFPDVWKLMDFTTVEELAEMMTGSCLRLAEAVNRTMPETKNRMIEEIIRYIRTHGKEYQFTIQQMAEDFGVSTSYLSRYFKEKTGGTLSEFVHQERIEEAKRLLLADDRPVKEIIQQIGYADPSSFTRKFKAAVGLTPQEFRKVHLSHRGTSNFAQHSR